MTVCCRILLVVSFDFVLKYHLNFVLKYHLNFVLKYHLNFVLKYHLHFILKYLFIDCMNDCRYKDLQEKAQLDHGSVRNMVTLWAKEVKKRANKERSTFVSEIKKLWLGNASSYAIATNFLQTDLNKKQGDIIINPAIVATGLATVDEIRNCIKSNAMYKNSALYDLLCSGIESGKLKNNRKRGPTSIRNLLTIAHEANIRLELHYNMQSQKSRHHPSHDHGIERKATWKVFMNLVLEDRQANEQQATEERRGNVVYGDGNPPASDSEDEAESLDPKFFNE